MKPTLIFAPEEAVDYYLDHFCHPLHLELEICSCAINSSLDPVDIATVLVHCEHQFRLPNETKKDLVEILAKAKPWSGKYVDFEELYKHIKQLIAPRQCIVTVYDIAKRIGWAIGCLPDAMVYGTSRCVRRNARSVLAKGAALGNRKAKSDFVPWLQKLTSLDIEIFLCVVRSLEECPSEGRSMKIALPAQLPPYRNDYPIELRRKLATLANGKFASCMNLHD